MQFRTATEKDISRLIEIREKQLTDEGQIPDADIGENLRDYFEKHFLDHSLIEWLAEENGAIVGTAAVVFMDFPPDFINVSGMTGYIANVYTAPDYRRKGIATALLKRVIDEARNRNINMMFLEASQMGRPVYTGLGFRQNEKWMQLEM